MSNTQWAEDYLNDKIMAEFLDAIIDKEKLTQHLLEERYKYCVKMERHDFGKVIREKYKGKA